MIAMLFVAACGAGDSGFAGAYQVTVIGENPDACGNLVQRVILPGEEYFELSEIDFGGIHQVGHHECTGQGACEVDPSRFYEKLDGEWVEEFSSADGLAMPCYVSVTQTTLGRINDTEIELHTVQRSGDIAAFPDGCPRTSDDFLDWDAVRPHYGDLPCVGETIVEATLLQ
jgi:hypothetical protein